MSLWLMKSFIWKFNVFIAFSAVNFNCKIGDGNGHTEYKLSGSYTKEGCITAVKAQYPNANGATMDANCPSTCRCYAEIGMTGWSGSGGTNYQSCMLNVKCQWDLPNEYIGKLFQVCTKYCEAE